MARLMVTGAAGQLGTDLMRHAAASCDEAIGLTRADLDIGDHRAVLDAVSAIKPDVVINAGAWTAVDACESDRQRAFRDNASAVEWLQQGCQRVGAHLVQISTDYVFDGTLDRPYREDDLPNPMSAYGASKLAGERAADPTATIVRTSWVSGAAGSNMVKTVLRLLDQDVPMAFVADQHGCPTFTADLAPLVWRMAVERRPGIFHATNAGAVSWYEFVGDIIEVAGGDRGRVRPISSAELQPPRPAPRPANSVLENAALATAGIPLLGDYRRPLAELVAELT